MRSFESIPHSKPTRGVTIGYGQLFLCALAMLLGGGVTWGAGYWMGRAKLLATIQSIDISPAPMGRLGRVDRASALRDEMKGAALDDDVNLTFYQALTRRDSPKPLGPIDSPPPTSTEQVVTRPPGIPVRVESAAPSEPVTPKSTAAPRDKVMALSLGLFKIEAEAKKMVQKLHKKGVVARIEGQSGNYRVLVGGTWTLEEALEHKQRLESQKIASKISKSSATHTP